MIFINTIDRPVEFDVQTFNGRSVPAIQVKSKSKVEEDLSKFGEPFTITVNVIEDTNSVRLNEIQNANNQSCISVIKNGCTYEAVESATTE
jgi:hypothetical protein